MGRITAVPWLVAMLLLSACSSTPLSSEWYDTSDDGLPPQKLAVIAVVKDDSISLLVEDESAHRLPVRAHAAAASRQLGFTPGSDIQAMREKLRHGGFDAVVITRLVAIHGQDIYYPPQTRFVESRPMFPPSALSPYYRDFWHFYPYAASVAVAPAYETSGARYVVETVLYRLPDGNPIRSAVTEMLNPTSTLVLINEVVRLVQKQMNSARSIDSR